MDLLILLGIILYYLGLGVLELAKLVLPMLARLPSLFLAGAHYIVTFIDQAYTRSQWGPVRDRPSRLGWWERRRLGGYYLRGVPCSQRSLSKGESLGPQATLSQAPPPSESSSTRRSV